MAINELYASHIRRVKASFIISDHDLIPAEITKALGMPPDVAASRGDERRTAIGRLISPEPEGIWMLSTKGKVNSKDINDHLQYLLNRLLPHHDVILGFVRDKGYETYIDVLWESMYLYAGTGPVIDRECIEGISQLHAGIGFDIYQINEDEAEETENDSKDKDGT
jgi:hypothetical protein